MRWKFSSYKEKKQTGLYNGSSLIHLQSVIALLLLKESSSQELLFHLLVKETWSDARFNILMNFS
jgi:hypothetical protein